MTPSFWVEEIHGDAQDDEHHDKDEVVLPPDALESDGVDESIEEDCDDSSHESDSQTSRPQAIRPDLARIGGLERRPAANVSVQRQRRCRRCKAYMAMSYPAKKMNRKGMTAMPVALAPPSANAPDSAVTRMKPTSMTAADDRKRGRRPSRSTENAAAVENMRFQTFRNAEIRVCSVTPRTPTVSRTMAR